MEGAAPTGPPRYGWFGGVLEGRVGDTDALRQAFAELESATTVPCDLDVEGGRFSLMFAEETLPGDALGLDRQNDLLDGLGRVLAASGDPAAAESTLRGSLVYGDEVVETLFAVVGGRIDPVSRKRPLGSRDPAGHAARREGALGGLDAPFRDVARGRGLMLLALILVGGLLAAWRSGYLGLAHDAITAPEADAVFIETGVFGETLELELDRRFAHYTCTIRRGRLYPATADEARELEDAAATTGERAAMNAVADGGAIWVRVVDEDGATLSAVEVELAELLVEEDGVAEVELRARAGGIKVELALSRGRSPGERDGDDGK